METCGVRCSFDDHDPGDEWVCGLPPNHHLLGTNYHAAIVIGGWHQWEDKGHETERAHVMDMYCGACRGVIAPDETWVSIVYQLEQDRAGAIDVKDSVVLATYHASHAPPPSAVVLS